MSELPVLNLGPDPVERGRIHGSTLRGAIHDNIETYLARFEAAGSPRADILKQGEQWLEFIRADNDEYATEMVAISEASGVSAVEIAMLNARYEIAYLSYGDEARRANELPEQEGCTSFGLMPDATASGKTILAQNWDWLEGVLHRTYIQRIHRSSTPGEGKPDVIGFSEAGIVGSKMGVNAAGIGLCVNGLVSPEDGSTGLRKPFHVRCREILDSWRFDLALLPVVQTDRTTSANFLIGHADGEIINIETTPRHCAYIYPEDGIVAHANHLAKETRTTSELERISPSTLFRGARIERLLRKHLGHIGQDEIVSTLRDDFSAPMGICRLPDPDTPPEKRTMTVAAVVVDLNDRVLHVSDGPPNAAPLIAYPLYE